jgi:hypothetical protein
MWLRHEQRYNDDAGRRHCRAAGKMLRRAKARGLVRDEQRGPNHLWFSNASVTGAAKPRTVHAVLETDLRDRRQGDRGAAVETKHEGIADVGDRQEPQGRQSVPEATASGSLSNRMISTPGEGD